MNKVIIKRDGLPPIAFTGEIIGTGDNKIGPNGYSNNRWTIVSIYRTKSGKFVAHVRRRSQWVGEDGTDIAASFGTAAEVIEWLKEDADQLGSVSQEAVEEAAEDAPEFAAAWVEEVE